MALTKAELGKRIKSARESCGLTQEQLGEFSELNRIAVGQIESGARSVSTLELERIARAVGWDIKSFFVESFVKRDALAALFRSDKEIAEQADLVRALQDSLALGHEMTNLERLLEIDRVQLITASYDLSVPKSRWDAIQQGQKIATEERQRLGLGVSPSGDLGKILESQGIRVAVVALPENISGLTLFDEKIGVFVVINATHASVRQRFSLSHEFGHVLMDRGNAPAPSRAENRSDLLEVRANAFAAEFLLPADGVAHFVVAFGKGGASRSQITVFDESEPVQVEQRAVPGSQDIQIYDLALLAHHFGASRISTLYRLKNIRLINESEFKRLLMEEESGAGNMIASVLAAPEPTRQIASRDDFRRRFLALAFEAYRREEITRSKLMELASMVGVDQNELHGALASAKLD